MTIASRRTINFKHVGTKISNRKFTQAVNQPSTPIGMKTPLRLGEGLSNLFDMHFQPADQLHDNLKNLIKTNHGERLGYYNYGANLKSLSFDLAYVGEFEERAVLNIRDSVEKVLPIIEIEDCKVITTNHEKSGVVPDSIAQILIQVTYNIPKLKIIGKKIQAVIYAGG